MLVGAIAPIPFWLWQRRFPDTRLKFINLPVMLNGPTLAPPANGINYVSWFIVGFIFRMYFSFIHAKLSGRSLKGVWRESGGSMEECWRDSPCLPCPRGRSLTDLRKLLGGFNPARLSHRHRLRFVYTPIGVEPLSFTTTPDVH